MRIYMQMPPGENRAPRFYHLHLQEDLLEGWTLVSESGYQGSPGRVKREYFSDRDTALQALIRNRDNHLKRGYRIVFAQGETPSA
jgi:predicted DNA-binding WGR domain protein